MLLIVAATEPELRGVPDRADVEALACGVGPIDAGIAVATRLATDPRPALLLHVGIAGARRASGIAPGTVVIGERSVYCDTRSRLVAHVIEPAAEALRAARIALPDAVVHTIGTSAEVGGSSDCEVEAMEGFAVLRAAQAAGVPALEIRVVSNEIEEADREQWRFADALAQLERILPIVCAAP